VLCVHGSPLYQWDLNRQIKIDTTTLPQEFEVHFCHQDDKVALIVEPIITDTDVLANIPNILLQESGLLKAYIVVDGDTIYDTSFYAIARPKPDDYVYEETEVKRWEDLEKRVDDKLEYLDEVIYDFENTASELESDILLNSIGTAQNKVKIDNHEKRITNIEHHITKDYFVTDDSVAYAKVVPENVCPFAQVNKIGGRTYQCKNLLKYPFYQTTRTMAGITFTDNGDGSITINGKNDGSANSTFYISHISKKPLHLKAGNYSRYPITKNTSIAMSITDGVLFYTDNFTLDTDKDFSVYLRINKGDTTVFDNVTVYPMLNRGSTALPYEPYWEGLRDTKVTALKSSGSNLLNPAEYNVTGFAGYKNLSIECNEKGALVVNGRMNEGPTYTADVTKSISILNLPAGTYTLSFKTTGKGFAYFSVFTPDGNTNEHLVAKVTADEPTFTFNWTTEDAEKYPYLNLQMTLYGMFYLQNIPATSERYPYEDYTIYLMLNEGSTALPYSPYGEIDTFPIPEEIQAIEGYGQSNPDNPDECNYVDFEGYFVGKGHIVDGAWVANRAPIKTDVSEYLTDIFIEVAGGGIITAVNEYNTAVPSSITYLLKEGSI
jgi:hypothetical protein